MRVNEASSEIIATVVTNRRLIYTSGLLPTQIGTVISYVTSESWAYYFILMNFIFKCIINLFGFFSERKT